MPSTGVEQPPGRYWPTYPSTFRCRRQLGHPRWQGGYAIPREAGVPGPTGGEAVEMEGFLAPGEEVAAIVVAASNYVG